jgi:hypothetical protein
MWTLRRRQRGRCAMPAPRPGAFTFMIVNASVAGKYAYYFVFFISIYSFDKRKLHSRLTKGKKRSYDSSSPFFFLSFFLLLSKFRNRCNFFRNKIFYSITFNEFTPGIRIMTRNCLNNQIRCY